MTERLPAHLDVAAAIRRAEAIGGTAAVVARGDRDAGAILFVLMERGSFKGLLERRAVPGGYYRWALDEDMINQSLEIVDRYLTRRRAVDPDLWVVELNVVGVERFAADMASVG